MINRYFIILSFKGTAYHGWQSQPNTITVQQTIEQALSIILNNHIPICGAGRTDAGVHAKYFCAHFDCDNPDLHLRNDFLFRLNCLLPNDIAVSRIIKVDTSAHARFSALSRTYKYYIALSKSPFTFDYSWFLNKPLNTDLMNVACKQLMNYRDFTSFSKLHTDVKTNICHIMEAGWQQENDFLVFTIKADRFLRNMVRAIVGTITDIGRGKSNLEEFGHIIEAADRCKAGMSVPAKGLFLADIQYPEGMI